MGGEARNLEERLDKREDNANGPGCPWTAAPVKRDDEHGR